MSFTPGDPRAPAADLGTRKRDRPGDPLARPARGTGEILVTGGAGRLGRVVCRLLKDAGLPHRALVRPRSDRSWVTGHRTWLIDGDLTRPETLVGPLDGAREVLHLAGLVRSSDRAALSALHVEGTRALVTAARAAGVRRIVAISSDTVLRSVRSAYAESKAEMEALLEAAADADLSVVVLRPPMILGPGSPHLASLEAAARRRLAPIPAGGADRAPVHVEDVASAVLAARSVPEEALTDGFLAIDLPGAEAVSFGELLLRLCRVRGWREPRLLAVPIPAARRAARALGLVAPSAGRRLDERLVGMAEQVGPDGAPARRLLAWSPRPLDAVLAS